jgi:hypothetical protein
MRNNFAIIARQFPKIKNHKKPIKNSFIPTGLIGIPHLKSFLANSKTPRFNLKIATSNLFKFAPQPDPLELQDPVGALSICEPGSYATTAVFFRMEKRLSRRFGGLQDSLAAQVKAGFFPIAEEGMWNGRGAGFAQPLQGMPRS